MNSLDSSRSSEVEVLKGLLGADPAALDQFYVEHRSAFLRFASRYQLVQEDVLDAYQEAVIVFFEQLMAGKLDALKSSVKTYLFSIGKYKLIDRIREKDKTLPMLENQLDERWETNAQEEQLTLTHRQQQLREALDELGGKCRELLLLFYYQRYSIDAIRTAMGYKTDNVVKAHKSRCMKSLREIAMRKDLT